MPQQIIPEETCHSCGNPAPTMVLSRHTIALCSACGTVCSVCDEVQYTEDTEIITAGDSLHERVCSNCAHWCYRCDAVWILNELETCLACQLTPEEDDDDDEYEDSDSDGAGVHSYNYRPTLVFHGTGPLYLGIEQEMEFPSASNSSAVLEYLRTIDRQEQLFFVKHDGSLHSNGLEIVSHPMAPEWALTDYPFELQQTLREQRGIPNGNAGIHIHVSRDAFTRYHAWKFTYFHYANPAFVQAIAGRDPSQWASLKATAAKRRMTKPGAVDIAVNGMSISSAIRNKWRGGERYTAVNQRNEATMELRYFASTTSTEVLRGYIDYVRALYEFTKIARVRNRKDSKRDLSGLAFRRWAAAEERFPDLMWLLENRSIGTDTSMGSVAVPTGMEWKSQ